MQQLDLMAVLRRSRSNRSFILAVVLPPLILVASFFFERTYSAETVVLRNQTDGMPELSSGLLRNIQSFVGADLAASGGGQKGIAHFKLLTSKKFVLHFIEEQELARSIFPDRWDAKLRSWKEPSGFSLSGFRRAISGDEEGARAAAGPTAIQIYQQFMRKHLLIQEDDLGVITITIFWSNPEDAARISNAYVTEANSYIRNIDVSSMTDNLSQLEGQYNSARIEDLKRLISNMMAEQIKGIALAKSQLEYAFQVIDPAIPNFRNYSPDYVAIFIASLLTVLLSVVIGNYIFLIRNNPTGED